MKILKSVLLLSVILSLFACNQAPEKKQNQKKAEKKEIDKSILKK